MSEDFFGETELNWVKPGQLIGAEAWCQENTYLHITELLAWGLLFH